MFLRVHADETRDAHAFARAHIEERVAFRHTALVDAHVSQLAESTLFEFEGETEERSVEGSSWVERDF